VDPASKSDNISPVVSHPLYSIHAGNPSHFAVDPASRTDSISPIVSHPSYSIHSGNPSHFAVVRCLKSRWYFTRRVSPVVLDSFSPPLSPRRGPCLKNQLHFTRRMSPVVAFVLFNPFRLPFSLRRGPMPQEPMVSYLYVSSVVLGDPSHFAIVPTCISPDVQFRQPFSLCRGLMPRKMQIVIAAAQGRWIGFGS
jgi:hypothetical protein